MSDATDEVRRIFDAPCDDADLATRTPRDVTYATIRNIPDSRSSVFVERTIGSIGFCEENTWYINQEYFIEPNGQQH